MAELLPVTEPPNSPAFRWEAAKIGMKATWTAGLIIGVALLIANNPRVDVPRLSYVQLVRYLPLVFAITAIIGAVLGFAGYVRLLVWTNSDFAIMVAKNEWRPRRFMAVFGVHLGGYVGGVIGTVVATIRVARSRNRLRGISPREN